MAGVTRLTAAPLTAARLTAAPLTAARLTAVAPSAARLAASSIATATLLLSASSYAEVGDSDADYERPEAVKRGGFTIASYWGLGFTTASGFPADIVKIGDEQYRSTASGLGSSGNLYAGMAVRDWFVWGLGMNYASTYTSEAAYSGGSIALHVEAYPLFYKGGVWEDLGVYTDLGIGGGSITLNNVSVADVGGHGLIGLGVVYDVWRIGYFSFAPTLHYSHTFSDPLSSHAVSAGVRMALYTLP